MIAPIDKLNPVASLLGGKESASPVKESQTPFGDIFQSTIQTVKDTDAEKTEAQYLLATGQLDNPIALSVASAKNEIAVNILIQLRNKALDAYSELTRISM